MYCLYCIWVRGLDPLTGRLGMAGGIPYVLSASNTEHKVIWLCARCHSLLQSVLQSLVIFTSNVACSSVMLTGWRQTPQHTMPSNSPLMCKEVHILIFPNVSRGAIPPIHGFAGLSLIQEFHYVILGVTPSAVVTGWCNSSQKTMHVWCRGGRDGAHCPLHCNQWSVQRKYNPRKLGGGLCIETWGIMFLNFILTSVTAGNSTG